MKKTTGAISFFGGIISTLLLLHEFSDRFDNVDGGGLLVYLSFFILGISVIHYTLATKFWTSKISVIESLERENQIIRKQIEKKELLVKLQNLEEK